MPWPELHLTERFKLEFWVEGYNLTSSAMPGTSDPEY